MTPSVPSVRGNPSQSSARVARVTGRSCHVHHQRETGCSRRIRGLPRGGSPATCAAQP